MTSVAILGATGHVGRSLALFLVGNGRYRTELYARRPWALSGLVDRLGQAASASHLDRFGETRCDVVVNCIGTGDPAVARKLGATLMRVTESFDERVFAYLTLHPDTLYVPISSGMVYGGENTESAREDSVAGYRPNRLDTRHCYGVAKLNSELKHRAQTQHHIVDLRLFGYVSRFLPLGADLFLSQIASALLQGTVLAVMPSDMIRDFAHPADVCRLIECCITSRPLNCAFDVYTTRPVSKFALLDHLEKELGLRWRIDSKGDGLSAALAKTNYYSEYRAAAKIGYEPQYSALEAVTSELRHLVAESAVGMGARR